MNTKILVIMKKLEKHPHILERLEALLGITENDSGKFDIADDAEDQIIIEIQAMGRELLQSWADNQVLKKTTALDKRLFTKQAKKNFTG